MSLPPALLPLLVLAVSGTLLAAVLLAALLGAP